MKKFYRQIVDPYYRHVVLNDPNFKGTPDR